MRLALTLSILLTALCLSPQSALANCYWQQWSLCNEICDLSVLDCNECIEHRNFALINGFSANDSLCPDSMYETVCSSTSADACYADCNRNYCWAQPRPWIRPGV